MLEIANFRRKDFFVDAIKVTSENIEEAAKWCAGDVRTDNADKKYVKVRVHRPLNDRQTMAYPGDRILYAGTGYKVYTEKAFKASFEPTTEKPPARAKGGPKTKRTETKFGSKTEVVPDEPSTVSAATT